PVDGRTFVALGIVLLAFSFFYTVIPLAFWRATPGMTARDLVSRAEGGEPLTFGQATRRWLGGVLTVILVGIPALALLTGRSLGDRWSGSFIVRSGAVAPA
ncbi:MAG: RDD family protein, partial [Thermoanaerobaculia bacterium]|nr:RDD family protein [Thermoanaerobaculia bacterium]